MGLRRPPLQQRRDRKGVRTKGVRTMKNRFPGLSSAPAWLLAASLSAAPSSPNLLEKGDAPVLPPSDIPLSQPPASAPESFRWAGAWTSSPAQETGVAGSWYDASRFADLEGRLETLGSLYREDPRQSCIALYEAVEILGDPLNTTTFLQLSGSQMLFLHLVLATTQTPTGAQLLSDLLPHDILLCADNENPSAQAFYAPAHRTITTQFRNVCRGYDAIPAPGQTPDTALFGIMLAAFMEEVAHAYQDKIRGLALSEKDAIRWAADVKMWDLAMEAHAKVLAALMMTEAFESGYEDAYAAKVQDGSPEAALIRNVSRILMTHGRDTLARKPSLLAPAFLAFFEDPQSMDNYFYQGAEVISTLSELHRIPHADFVAAFGQLPGLKGNMLSGIMQSALVESVAPQTAMGEWFAAQHAARRERKAGPSLPLAPEGLRLNDEERCTVSSMAQTAQSPTAP